MISPDALRIAAQIALVSFASYELGFYSTSWFHGSSASIGGLWSAISGIVVLQATRRATWSSASLRVLGTVIGSITCATWLAFQPFSPLGMAVAMFATVLLCHAVRIPDHARLATITVAVIMVTAQLDPTLSPTLNAALRLGESCIGTAMAMLAALAWPGPDERRTRSSPGA